MKNIFAFLADVLFSIGIWYITTWTNPQISIPSLFRQSNFWKELYTKAYAARVVIVIIILSIVIIIKTIIRCIDSDRKKKSINWLINHILKTECTGHIEVNRITIFRYRWDLVKIIKIIWKYGRMFRKNFPGDKQIPKNYLPNLFHKALFVAYRRGTPNQNGSLAFFLQQQDPAKSDGIVSWVWNTEQDTLIQDFNFDPITIDEMKAKYSDQVEWHKIQKKVRKIKIDNPLKMLMVSRISKHYWATILYTKKEKKWGVLVFDSEEDVSPLTPEKIERLKSYTGIIRNVL